MKRYAKPAITILLGVCLLSIISFVGLAQRRGSDLGDRRPSEPKDYAYREDQLKDHDAIKDIQGDVKTISARVELQGKELERANTILDVIIGILVAIFGASLVVWKELIRAQERLKVLGEQFSRLQAQFNPGPAAPVDKLESGSSGSSLASSS